MKSVPLDIRVEFSVKGNTLEYKVLYDKTEAGEVVCVSSDSLTSGAVVIEGASYYFMAVPKKATTLWSGRNMFLVEERQNLLEQLMMKACTWLI